MTLLLSCKEISKAHGPRTLFEGLSFGIFEGDKLGIIGANGTGKTTLLRILADLEPPGHGEVVKRQHVALGYVPQDSPPLHDSLESILLDCLENDPRELYEKETAVRIYLDKAGFQDGSTKADTLSGGWRKRLEILRQMIKQPDLLLLDEPTNHLDLEGILWLEEFLSKQRCSYVIVSHDRVFLNTMAEKILELGPQYPEGLFKVDVPYFQFVQIREEFLEGQRSTRQSLSTKVRRETAWLRATPKARTTKSVARIQRAEEWMSELKDLKKRGEQKRVAIDFSASQRETRNLIVVKNLGISYGERELFRGLDCTLSPGTRMGLMGANGSGKTTFLRLLAQELKPSLGTIKYADDLCIVYFDQYRFELPQGGTLRTALSPNGDFVHFRGQDIHVHGWGKRFLFAPEILDMPLSALSGGERARLLIAKLMLQPADILLLDEPTNDLDIPTLELLEENLKEFTGAVVLITHDRYLLARVCNKILALGDISPPPLFADYSLWEKWQRERQLAKSPPLKVPPSTPPPKKEEKKRQKLTWKQQKEMEELEKKIPLLEEKIASFHLELNNPSLQDKSSELLQLCKGLQEAESELERCYTRWGELQL